MKVSGGLSGKSVSRGLRRRRMAAVVVGLTALFSAGIMPRLGRAPAGATASAATPLPGRALTPQTGGSWTAPLSMNAIAIHAALLYTGNVLMWYSDQPIGSGTGSVAVVWNPATNSLTQNNVPYPLDVFCAGSIMLPNGRVMVVGGKNDSYGVGSDAGIANVLEYIPYSNTWTQITPMNFGRWYATAVELPSGDVMVASGENSTATHIVFQMETYSNSTNKWTVLPNSADVATTTNFYPRLILLPTGNIFEPGMVINNGLFNPTTNAWSSVPATPSFWTRIYGGAVLLPGLEKVLSVGGRQGDDQSTAATNSTSIVDFSQPNPVWVDGCGADQPAGTTCVPVSSGGPAPMNAIRENMNLVLMPDGTVLAEGGGSGGGKYSNPVYYPEDYDPVKNTWTSYNSQVVQRTYHSTALLLPDGRVFSAGSDWGTQEKTLEVFSPPYLSNGSRPTITSAPTLVKYGQQFTINTPNASTITRVALIKVASCTHATRFDERFVDLTFTIGSGSITATAPASGNYAPPGYYMLDILNSSGVPAVMPFIQVTN